MLGPLSSHFYSSQEWCYPHSRGDSSLLSETSLKTLKDTQRCVSYMIANLAKTIVKRKHHANVTGYQVPGALPIGSVVH